MKLTVLDIIISTISTGCIAIGIYFFVEYLIEPDEINDKWTNETIRQLSVGLYSSMITFSNSLPSIVYKNLCVTWPNVYCIVDCIRRDYKYTTDYSQIVLPYSVLKTAGDYNFICMSNCIGVIGNWSPYFYFEIFSIESKYLPLAENKCYMDYIQTKISPLNFIELLMGDQNVDATYQKGLENLMREALTSCKIIEESQLRLNQIKDPSILQTK